MLAGLEKKTNLLTSVRRLLVVTFCFKLCKFSIPQGNRWLRGQKSNETKSLEDVVYPRRGEKDSWNFFKILECCYHFLGEGKDYSIAWNLLFLDYQIMVLPLKETAYSLFYCTRCSNIKCQK